MSWTSAHGLRERPLVTRPWPVGETMSWYVELPNVTGSWHRRIGFSIMHAGDHEELSSAGISHMANADDTFVFWYRPPASCMGNVPSWRMHQSCTYQCPSDICSTVRLHHRFWMVRKLFIYAHWHCMGSLFSSRSVQRDGAAKARTVPIRQHRSEGGLYLCPPRRPRCLYVCPVAPDIYPHVGDV